MMENFPSITMLSLTDAAKENDVSKEGDPMVIPEIVSQVIEEFATAMRNDPDIPKDAIGRLVTLLRKGTVPKPDEINTALFEPPTEE